MEHRPICNRFWPLVALVNIGLCMVGCKTDRCPSDLSGRFRTLARAIFAARSHAPRIQPRRAFECFDVPTTDAVRTPLPRRSLVLSLTPLRLTSMTFWVGEQAFAQKRYGKNRADWLDPSKERGDRDCLTQTLDPKVKWKGLAKSEVVIAVTGDTPVSRVADLLGAVHAAGTKEVWLAFGARNVASLPAAADRAYYERMRSELKGKTFEAARATFFDAMEKQLEGCAATKKVFGALISDNEEKLFSAAIEEMLVPALKECRCSKSVDTLQTLILLTQEPQCHFVGRKVVLNPSRPGLRAKGTTLWRNVAHAAIGHDAASFWITLE